MNGPRHFLMICQSDAACFTLASVVIGDATIASPPLDGLFRLTNDAKNSWRFHSTTGVPQMIKIQCYLTVAFIVIIDVPELVGPVPVAWTTKISSLRRIFVGRYVELFQGPVCRFFCNARDLYFALHPDGK
jgi:hypothetical protein